MNEAAQERLLAGRQVYHDLCLLENLCLERAAASAAPHVLAPTPAAVTCFSVDARETPTCANSVDGVAGTGF